MKNKSLSIVSLIIGLFVCFKSSASEIWENNTPGALVKKIEIFHNDDPSIFDNPIQPTVGSVNLTFQNDVVINNLALHPIAGSFTPQFFLSAAGENYESFTVYYCRPAGAIPVDQICDGIALKLVNGQLCAGYFSYTTLMNRVATIADIGCFTRMGSIVNRVQVHNIKELQKYTKEQLIEIIEGRQPIKPIGPVCLSCPPWDAYEKDMTKKLKNLKVKKYKIEVKEVK